MEKYDVLIVGAGLTGATIAERCATHGYKVLLIDKRDHIGGNVYDFIDSETNIRVSKYGAHIFHTNDKEVWDYVNRFSAWERWDHKVLAFVKNKYVPIPITLETINSLYNLSLQTESEMKEFLKNSILSCENPTNSEELSLSRVGKDMYETFFKHYTKKQWNKYPAELDPSVLARIPIRFTQDTRYFTDKYQALPTNGYTAMVSAMVSHPNITVQLNKSYESVNATVNYSFLVFTGPIDAYFKDKGLPTLEYRSIHFHTERFSTMRFYQPVSVVNYPEANIPYTRTVEYKHFLAQSSEGTIVVHETTTDTGEPYYPVPNTRNQELYKRYQELSQIEESKRPIGFVGRLASYKYFNMDQAIRTALDFFTDRLHPFLDKEHPINNDLDTSL